MSDEVRYRYYCDTCSESSDWVETSDDAQTLEDQHHDEQHPDGLAVSRIQRFPLEAIERGDVR